MKNIILALLLFSNYIFGAAVPITGLPPITGAQVGTNDVMPMVSLSLNQTSKLKLSQLLQIPALQNPTFSSVSATNFAGLLTGDVIGNVTGNVIGNLTGNVTGNVSGTATNVSGVVGISHGGTGQTTFGSGALSSNGSALSSGTLSLANGGTGQTSFSSGAVSSNGSALTASTLSIGNGGTGQTSFGSGAVTSNGSALTSGTLSVANGGTGATTLTSHNVILGNGASAVGFVAPGTSGNILTSNGTTWTSAAAVSGGSKQVVAGGNVTSDASLNVTSYAAFSPSVTVSFTATANAKYLIWVNITSYALPSDGMHYQIANTVGSATTVFQDSSEADSTGVRVPMYIYGIFTLSSGVAYTFELQGRCTSGGSNAITLNNASRDNGVTMIAQQIE